MKTRILSLALAGGLLAACSDDPSSPPSSADTIHLSAAQSTAIRARVGLLAPVHPELAWLADSIALVVGGGIEVRQVDVTTNSSDGPYYAVALQRTIKTSFSGSAAFDVILFNNPSDPTDFIIASGWTNPGNSTVPPTSMSGQFGSPTLTSIVSAHFFHVSGSTVTAWRANAGTASFSLGGTSASCPSVPNNAVVTCQIADLHAAFNITSAMSDNLTISSTRSASLSSVDVSGILIKILIQ